jgi:hypothetical protein
MSYIGNTPTTTSFTPAVDYFSGNGSTTAFTLSRPVASVAQVEAVIDNVVQNPSSAYTVSSNTITFTSAPLSGTNNIYVRYTSPITQVIAPGQGTVGTTALADASVTTAKLASTTGTGAVALASLPTFTTTVGVGGTTAANSGAGVSFPATQSASSDANTLDDYEEGTWTPTDNSGAGLSFTTSATYIKIGQTVIAWCQINYPSTANGNGAAIAGLPFTTASQDVYGGFTRYSTSQYIYATLAQGGTYGSLYNTSGSQITNATLSSKRVDFTYVYRSNA